MTTCSKCKRPVAVTLEASLPGNVSICRKASPFLRGADRDDATEECDIVATVYARGIRDMLAVAKRTTRLTSDYYPKINWTETEREAAKLAGEG